MSFFCFLQVSYDAQPDERTEEKDHRRSIQFLSKCQYQQSRRRRRLSSLVEEVPTRLSLWFCLSGTSFVPSHSMSRTHGLDRSRSLFGSGQHQFRADQSQLDICFVDLWSLLELVLNASAKTLPAADRAVLRQLLPVPVVVRYSPVYSPLAMMSPGRNSHYVRSCGSSKCEF